MKYLMLMFFLPLLFVKTVWAECAASDPQQVSMPLLSQNLTIGEDLPDGAVLFHQSYKQTQAHEINCSSASDSATGFKLSTDYTSAGLGLSSWTSTPSGSGKVYETGIQGIGFVVIGSDARKPAPYESNTLCKNCTTSQLDNSLFDADVFLIKTGPVLPGSLQGGSLPCLRTHLNDGVSGGELFDVGEMCFSGSINIVSKTCTTPDITVDMGSYSLNTLKVKGKTTGWKDASIHLVNCPVFYGRGEESSSTRWSQNGSSTVADNIENVISVKITPGTDVLDDEKGIFSLTKETDSAQGIGVQLAYGTADMADIFALSKSKDFPRPLNSSGEVTIPLVARYIQTEDKVSSGQADSIATYTISYR